MVIRTTARVCEQNRDSFTAVGQGTDHSFGVQYALTSTGILERNDGGLGVSRREDWNRVGLSKHEQNGIMSFFTSPTAFDRLRFQTSALTFPRSLSPLEAPMSASSSLETPIALLRASHPALGHLTLLVFEAVLEVVCVSLPGYIVARRGMFDADSQKFVANLNVALFTPCLSRWLPKTRWSGGDSLPWMRLANTDSPSM